MSAFTHRDSERVLVFGERAVERGIDLLDDGYTLLTTGRALQESAIQPALESLQARAAKIVNVPPGSVEALASQLQTEVKASRLVALGGGRVVDVAKALAAANPPCTVAAIPTTLSGAEMTGMHRLVPGMPRATPRVRPNLVMNDPALSASAPVPQLAASSANALGHALVALVSINATPLADLAGRDGALRIARGWAGEQPERSELALGALLAGWAVDHTGLGLHHVLAQSAVRTAGLGHAQANVALLPVTIGALRSRSPGPFAALEAQLGVSLDDVTQALRERAGVRAPVQLAREERLLDLAVSEAAARPELAGNPPAADAREIRALYLAAAGADSLAADRVARAEGSVTRISAKPS